MHDTSMSVVGMSHPTGPPDDGSKFTSFVDSSFVKRSR